MKRNIHNKRKKGKTCATCFAAAAGLALFLVCRPSLNAYAMNVEGMTRELSGPVANTQPESGEWRLDNGKWHFRTAAGEVRGRWACIADKAGNQDWYCFDGQGIMYTGWQKSSAGNWYYLREEADSRQGAMEKGFVLDKSDGSCYYMDPGSGIMRTGWIYFEGNFYYFSESGGDVRWYWDGELGKWRAKGAGRPYGAMYRNERTPDGYMTDGQGRRV